MNKYGNGPDKKTNIVFTYGSLEFTFFDGVFGGTTEVNATTSMVACKYTYFVLFYEMYLHSILFVVEAKSADLTSVAIWDSRFLKISKEFIVYLLLSKLS